MMSRLRIKSQIQSSIASSELTGKVVNGNAVF